MEERRSGAFIKKEGQRGKLSIRILVIKIITELVSGRMSVMNPGYNKKHILKFIQKDSDYLISLSPPFTLILFHFLQKLSTNKTLTKTWIYWTYLSYSHKTNTSQFAFLYFQLILTITNKRKSGNFYDRIFHEFKCYFKRF